MAFSAAEVDQRLNDVLQDASRKRWTAEERVRWINDGVSEIVIRRPAAHAQSLTLTLVAGSLQTLPAGGVELLDIPRNITAADKPGRAVRRIDRALLDDTLPDWHSGREQTAVKHFTFDERLPKEFYVYPPVKAGTKIEAKVSTLPARIAALTDQIDLDPLYIAPLVSYVAYRAQSKDSEYGNGAVAIAHFNAFNEALGTQNQSTLAASPNQEAAA
jgi:hypothetical protein